MSSLSSGGIKRVCCWTSLLGCVWCGSAALVVFGSFCTAGASQFCPPVPGFLGGPGNHVQKNVAIPMLIIGGIMFVIVTSVLVYTRDLGRSTGTQNNSMTASKALGFLYGSHFMSAWGDRMWQIAVPIFLIDIFKSTLLPTSLYTVLVYVSSVLFMPTIGAWIDRTSRLTVQRVGLIVENFSVVCTGGVIVYLVSVDPGVGDETQNFSSPHILTSYVIFVLLGIIGELFNNAQTLSIEKDWVVVIARVLEVELSQLNTTLRRIDLSCKALAPGAFAFIYQSVGTTNRERIFYGAVVIAFWNAASFPIELILNTMLYSSFPALRMKLHRHSDGTVHSHSGGQKPHHHLELTDVDGNVRLVLDENDEAIERGRVRVIDMAQTDEEASKGWLSSWTLYMRNTIFPASLAYTLLWMTVLDNGSLMTSYLLWRGVPPVYFGFSRGAGAVFGLLGTTCFLCIKHRVGSLEKVGMVAIWLFWALLVPGVVSFYLAGASRITDYILMASMSISRVGLWAFDLVITQLTQEGVCEKDRGSFGGAQTASYQAFYVVVNLMGMIFPNPAQFVVVVTYSVAVVLCSALIYSKWYLTGAAKNVDPAYSSLKPKTLRGDGQAGDANTEYMTL